MTLPYKREARHDWVYHGIEDRARNDVWAAAFRTACRARTYRASPVAERYCQFRVRRAIVRVSPRGWIREALPSMKNLPVHWSEGMFLRPHHFQAADRHWAEM